MEAGVEAVEKYESGVKPLLVDAWDIGIGTKFWGCGGIGAIVAAVGLLEVTEGRGFGIGAEGLLVMLF